MGKGSHRTESPGSFDYDAIHLLQTARPTETKAEIFHWEWQQKLAAQLLAPRRAEESQAGRAAALGASGLCFPEVTQSRTGARDRSQPEDCLQYVGHMCEIYTYTEVHTKTHKAL